MLEPLSRNSNARHRRRSRRRAPRALAALLLVLALALAASWVAVNRDASEPAAAAVVEPTGAAAPAPVPREPLRRMPDLPRLAEDAGRARAPELRLPALDESDAQARGALTELLGAEVVAKWLRPEHVIRNLVVTIDNLPRPALALEQRPFRSAPGEFLVSGPEGARVLDEANFERYAPFIDLAAGLDAEAVVDLYERYRPLFTEAYRDLGYPDGDFDARLVEVVGHLLAAPSVAAPIRLAQPSVLYEFADEQLESSSAGHKLMIRFGPENAAAAKRKLRELLAALEARR